MQLKPDCSKFYFIFCIFFVNIFFIGCLKQDLKNTQIEIIEQEYKYPIKINEKYEYLMNYFKCQRIIGERIIEKEKIRIYKKNGKVIKEEIISTEKKKDSVDFVLELNDQNIVVKVHDLSNVEQHKLKATMYYPGDPLCWKDGKETYLGYKMARGIVAIDPKVYKFKSKMFIPHYGIGYAVDKGGAIKGKRIDLGVMTAKEADEFGIRSVKVFLLKD